MVSSSNVTASAPLLWLSGLNRFLQGAFYSEHDSESGVPATLGWRVVPKWLAKWHRITHRSSCGRIAGPRALRGPVAEEVRWIRALRWLYTTHAPSCAAIIASKTIPSPPPHTPHPAPWPLGPFLKKNIPRVQGSKANERKYRNHTNK